MSQLNLNRYYSPVVELVGVGITALGVALSYAAVNLRFIGFVSFTLIAAVFFAVAAIYSFVQFLSDWNNLRQNAVPKFFRLKLLISSVAALISFMLLLKLESLPFMLNSENLWPSTISFIPGNAGLWLPLFLFIAYLLFSSNSIGVFKVWLKAILLAAAAASFLFTAVVQQKLTLQIATGLFAPCWINVLVCAYLDRQKDDALNIPTLMGEKRKFPMKLFLLFNAAIFTALGFNSVSVFFSGAGLIFYHVSLLILVFFEHKLSLFAKRWLPDLLLFTAFL